MVRVGIVAADPDVAAGLSRLFRAVPADVTALPVSPGDGPPVGELDLVVVDVWPSTARRAAALCAPWRRAQPRAAMVALVHQPTRALLGEVRRAGGTTIWPKDEVRALPGFATQVAVLHSARWKDTPGDHA